MIFTEGGGENPIATYETPPWLKALFLGGGGALMLILVDGWD